jgi:NAD(P)-dependent dehydrogenase (short-subunit alcohol dehydrogenase family)
VRRAGGAGGSTSAVVAGNTEADPGYKASKGGVLQLTKLVAAQYGTSGVRANCLCPGPIMTNIVQSGGADSANVDTFARLAQGVPLGRGGRPDEVASVASFLLSDESSFMTGATVMADGGFTAV